jgi:translocation and assembly module TamB
MATNLPPPTPANAAAGTDHVSPRRWWRWALWLPGVLLGLVLMAAAVLWTWAGTPGSLAQSLQWAQRWMQGRADSVGQLDVREVQGSLRHGGLVRHLDWSQGGLMVQAKGVRIDLNDAFWLNALLGRGVRLQGLAIESLLVNDQRPPSTDPAQPLREMTLPLAVSLPWSVGRFQLEGKTRLTLGAMRGRYAYGQPPLDGAPALPEALPASPASTHQLLLDELAFSGGRYSAQLTLGGLAPMPLALTLQGQTRTDVPGTEPITLQAQAAAKGMLAGTDAWLDLTAEVQSSAAPHTPGTAAPSPAPSLSAVARLMPWATQPLVSANVSTQALDLSSLWPQAPVTSLSGNLRAQPDGEQWRASLSLDNAASGPADLQRLPVQSLRMELSQTGNRWDILRLEAQLAGGQLKGNAQANLQTDSGSTRFTNWQGSLRATDVQPALVWSTLAPGALGGEWSASAVEGNAEAVDLQALVRPASRTNGNGPNPGSNGSNTLAAWRLEELRMQGRWTPNPGTPTQGVLDLREARLAMAGATLETSGQWDSRALRYAGQLQARLPGTTASWKGSLAHAQGDGTLNLQLNDATQTLAWVRSMQGLPVVGTAVREWFDGQPGLAMQGSASLEAQWQGGLGALGYPAPASASASSSTAGNPASRPAPPRLQATFNLPRLQVQTNAMGTATLSALRLQAQGGLDALQLDLNGTATRAPWQAALQSNGNLQVANGSWQNGRLNLSTLQLRLSQPDNSAPVADWSLKNAQPLQFQWSATPQGMAVDAGAGELQVRPNTPAPHTPTLAWDSLKWQSGALQTQGRLRGLPLAWVDSLSPVDASGQGLLRSAGLSGDLMFDGQWDVLLPADPAQALRLQASLQRSAGDLQLLSERSVVAAGAAQGRASAAAATTATPASVPALPSAAPPGPGTPGNGTGTSQPVAAGVREARIDLGVEGRTAKARLRWDSAQLGEMSADLSTELATPAPAGSPVVEDALERWWPASAPVSGTARARLPQVGVWSALAPPGWRVRGTLAADATLSGTRAAPEWRGSLQADDLAVRSVVDGFFFSGGQLRATLAGERVTIERFSLNGPRGAEVGGTLTATGTADWRRVEGSALRQPFINLTLNANRLRVASRADRRLTISGEVNAALAGPQLQLRGRLKADSALFVLPDETTPSLSSDVVVRTTRTLPPEPGLAERVKADVSVDLDLGEQFMVRGQGLETRLAGALNVRSTPGTPTPRITGEVRTVSGTYRAYGQQLAIENGALRFTGPYDNPSLDILAIRKLPEATGQRVGVQITGSAQVPRVRLFSDPELPDSEKLAWLVLGRPASTAGAQVFVLQQAARALLAGNQDLLDGELAKTFGLDEVGFQGETTAADGSTTEAAFTLGKRLSDDLYLSYEHSLSSAMSTVSMFYDLSRRLTLRARAGTENAVDLIFTVQYD